MKELLEKYAALKLVIKEAEAELKELQPTIKEQLEEGNKYDIGNAVIELMPGKPAWKYSEATMALDSELKATKKEEEQLGVATQVRGESFVQCNFKKGVV